MASTAYVSITDFGASSGNADNQTALQNAFDYAKAHGEAVYIPPGTYDHSGTLSIDGVTVYGAGDSSVLQATDPAHEAIYLTGANASLSDVAVDGTGSARLSTPDSADVVAQGASNFAIKDVHITGSASAGIMSFESSNGTIENNTVENTLADSIHLTDASHDITVSGNLVTNSGDDGIAVVSYAGESAPVSNVTIQGNTVLHNEGGRGVSVVGGTGVQILANHIEGGPADLAGIYIAAESQWNTYTVHNVLVQGNTITDAGGLSSGQGAITLYDSETGSNDGITVSGNQIDAPRKAGILVVGDGPQTATIENNHVYADASHQALNNIATHASLTLSGNDLLDPSAYPGDLVPAGGGVQAPTDPDAQSVGGVAPSASGLGVASTGGTDATLTLEQIVPTATSSHLHHFWHLH